MIATDTRKTDTRQQTEINRPRDQRLVYYHPNSAGNGAAMQLELRLNRRDPDRYNCFFLEMATQKTAMGRDGDRKVPATFDWEHKLTVKLDFIDVCELLVVLEGKADRAGGARNGLYHENGKACTVIAFQKNTEKGGYGLGLSRKERGGSQVLRVHIGLSEPEAVGLRSVFQTALFFMMFHSQLFPPAAGNGDWHARAESEHE